MKSFHRKAFSAATAICLMACAASAQTPRQALSRPESPVDSIIQLVSSGMSEGLILKQLRQANKPMDLSPADLNRLQQAHVSENIINAMMEPAGPLPGAATQANLPPQPPAAPNAPPTPYFAPSAAPVLERHILTLPVGMELTIRTIDAIDSRKGAANAEYTASLDGSLTVDGAVAVPAKSTVYLRVEAVKQAGVITGNASLTLRVVGILVNGQRIPVETEESVSRSEGKGKDTAIRTGGGAATGAVIGGIFGGGVGAGIGALAGAGAGAGSEAFSHKVVRIQPETRLVFRLRQPAAVN